MTQGRREGVKGVTVSRGPGLKKGARKSREQKELDKQKEFSHFGPQNSQALGWPIKSMQ